MKLKVLLAEDDRLIRQALAELLRSEGHEVLEAIDGQSALELFRQHQPGLVCLDIMMPRLHGYEVCRAIRSINADVPVIFITAKSDEVDKVLGLELGADDYIVKPFGAKEVIARLRAVLRRCHAASARDTTSFMMDDLEVFPREQRAKRGETKIELSQRDVQVLQLLYERAGEVVDRLTLFQRVWGARFIPNSRTLDQHISQLRKRIECDPSHPRIIQTVHGVGYRYDAR